jgi:carboxyl-terminal processing protease
LEEGDLILAVKQAEGEPVDVADMRINDVVKMIRGPKDTVVTLTVKKPDERVLTVAITRDVVVVEAAYARGALLDLGPKNDPVGYVYLPSFYGNTRSAKGQTPERDATDDVRALLERFAAKKVSSVVLDLRGNGGGLLNHATGIAGLFIDKGPIVQARNADNNMQVLGDDDGGVSFGGEVVVLVDRFSASASEILAGALQDYGRVLVVGTGPTHGKGTVQALIDLDRMTGGGSNDPLGVMKLTIQQFFLVDGESTQWKGVQPDIVLPDPASHVESGERYLDHAIPWSKVEPLPATPWPAPKWNRERLFTASQERQAKEEAFAKIRARGEYLGARREQTLVALQREAWRAQRDKDREELEKLDPKLDEGAARFSVETVDYRPSVIPPGTDARPASSTRIERWQETLAHDPWIQETLFLLAEMTGSQAPAKAAPRTGKPAASPGNVARSKPAAPEARP